MSNGPSNHYVQQAADHSAYDPLDQLQQAVNQGPFASSNHPNVNDHTGNGQHVDDHAQGEHGAVALASNSHVQGPNPISDAADPALDALISGDLSFPPVNHSSPNNPSREGWLYPHKKGLTHGSNLNAFKDEILERTARGENCKMIADALVAKGVQTSDRAVSRRRIAWGARKRAPRKLTEKSVENIRRAGAVRANLPPGQEASFRQKARVQIFRKAEITRMTQEGMSAEEIASNLSGRGMVLKKGVSTVMRLQTVWGLIYDENRHTKNIRHKTRKEVKLQQKAAFEDIAKELDIQDIPEWVKAKMSEPTAKEARIQLGSKIMGKYAPFQKLGRPPKDTALKKPRTPKKRDAKTAAASSQSLEQSDDNERQGTNMDLVDPASHKTANGEEEEDSSEGDSDTDSDSDLDDQLPSTIRAEVQNTVKQHYKPEQPPQMDSAGHNISHAPLADIDDQGDVKMNQGGAANNDPDPDSPANVAARVWARIGESLPESATTPKPAQQSDSQVPGASTSGASPQAPPRPHLMFGLVAPVAAQNAPAAAFNALPNQGRGRPPKSNTASIPKPVAAPVFEPPTAPMPNNPLAAPAHKSPPMPALTPVGPIDPLIQPAPRQTSNTTPAPALVLRPEEMDANKSTLSAVDQYDIAAKVFKEILQARTENRAMPGSLTGLPPSAKDVEIARQRLKNATSAMLSAL